MNSSIDKYLNEDIKLMAKIKQNSHFYDMLCVADSFCESTGINNEIAFYSYKIVSKQLDDCNCTYKDVLSFRRLKDDNYKKIVEDYLSSDIVKKQLKI